MSMAERSPSPLMFTKQYSDSEQSPSSSLTVPTVTMSSYPSPQVKRKFTEGVRKIKKLAKRSSTAENDYQDNSGSENPVKEKFAKVMNQLLSSGKQPKTRLPMANPILRRYSNNEDGYSSDPGITHDASDDEVDGGPDPDIERQINNTAKKLQKVREQLQQEEELMSRECQGGDSSQENETGGGGGEPRRSRTKIPFRLKQPGKNHDQLKKKIEKYENQLELLRNGVNLEGNHKFWIQVEDRIRSGGTTMLSGVKNRLRDGMLLLKIKNKPARPDEEDEDDILGGSPQDTHIMSNGDDESITLASNADELSGVAFAAIERENIERDLQEKLHSLLQQAEDRLSKQFSKQAELIENQRMTIERLENQLTEVIDLQQQGGQQVSELQKQLAQIQTHTMDKLQDFDDTIDEYQSKVNQLEVNMRSQEPFNPQFQQVVTSSTLVTKLLSILLVVISICLAIKTHMFNGYYLITGSSSDPIRKYSALTFTVIFIAIIIYLL